MMYRTFFYVLLFTEELVSIILNYVFIRLRHRNLIRQSVTC